MKLLTEMQDGCVHAMGYCVDSESVKPLEVARLEHDAAAAHALMRAIDDAASAEDGWANIYAERIRKSADELMREWGFEQDEVAR